MKEFALMAAVLLAGSAGAPSLRSPELAQCPDGSSEMLAAVTERFEVYAPGPESLENGVRGMERAVTEYERYMGEAAPRMALVLYDTPEQLLKYGEHCFRDRGLAYFRWRANMPGVPRIQTWPEIGAVIRELEAGELRVEALLPGGPRAGVDLQPGDRLVAVDGQQVRSLRDLRERRSTLQAGMGVTLDLERDGETLRVEWTAAAAGEGPPAALSPAVLQSLLAEATSEPTSANIVAHEAMHGLLNARFGLANLPAWFHEGLASLVEFDEDRERRHRQQLMRRLDNTYPLDELFRMQNPATQGTILRDPGSVPGGAFVVASNDPTGRSGAFYPQSMTLLQFLVERVGVDFPGRMARELATGRSVAEILRQVDTVPHDYEALHRAWLAWVQG